MKKLTLILILLSLGGFSVIASDTLSECEPCDEGTSGCPIEPPTDDMPEKLGE